MATTTTVQAAPKTITLSNGKSFTVASNASTTAKSIPLIDASRLYSDKLEERQALAEEVRKAGREIGFFTLVNHGVDMELAKGVFAQAENFFAQPLEKKMEVCTDLMPEEFCGYHPSERYNWEGAKLAGKNKAIFKIEDVPADHGLLTMGSDLHEAYNWNYDASKDPDWPDSSIPQINLWPKEAPEFQEKLCAYQTALISLARRLTRIFALALHLPEDAFDDYVRRPEAGMRILRYPEQTTSRDEQTGIGSHTDVECFTIVTQDSPGLEVLSKTGQWIKVQPVKDSFVVNIADCFMRQTNDFFVSTIHRVINENGKERYSAPFFWGFNRDTVLNLISTCVSDENPNKYPVMTAGEYYTWRTKRQKTMGMSGQTV